MRVLVTGAGDYLGRRLLEALRQDPAARQPHPRHRAGPATAPRRRDAPRRRSVRCRQPRRGGRGVRSDHRLPSRGPGLGGAVERDTVLRVAGGPARHAEPRRGGGADPARPSCSSVRPWSTGRRSGIAAAPDESVTPRPDTISGRTKNACEYILRDVLANAGVQAPRAPAVELYRARAERDLRGRLPRRPDRPHRARSGAAEPGGRRPVGRARLLRRGRLHRGLPARDRAARRSAGWRHLQCRIGGRDPRLGDPGRAPRDDGGDLHAPGHARAGPAGRACAARAAIPGPSWPRPAGRRRSRWRRAWRRSWRRPGPASARAGPGGARLIARSACT